MNIRRTTALGLSLAAVTLTACAGPKAPLDVGTQAAPLDLVLGEHEAVVEAPVGPFTLELPREVAPFRPISATPLPTTPPEPCPDFDPLSPVSAAGVTVTGPPQAASYTYRASTTDTVGAMTSKFKGDSTWKVAVGAVDAATGAFDFTTEVSIGDLKTSRVFRVQPQPRVKPSGVPPSGDPSDPATLDPNYQVIDGYNITAGPAGLPTLPRALPNLGRADLAGIQLVSQTTGDATFTPTAPIPLVYLPTGGTSFTGVGNDGVTTMKFNSSVPKTTYINACGKKIEAIQVDLTDGVIGGRTDKGEPYELAFTEHLYFGLQYGGLPVKDEGSVTGVRLPGGAPTTDTIERTFEFTANSQPKPAKS
jgi:hypothetical protein